MLMSIDKEVSVFWFRRDLRLVDNTALNHALDGNRPVLPIFIFDKNIIEKLENKNDSRINFIYNQVIKLKTELEQHGSTLMIFRDKPENVFKVLLNEYRLKVVFANRDYEPYAISRDTAVFNMLKRQDIPFNLFKDQLIFEGKEIVKNDGSPYQVFTPYKNVWLEKFKSLNLINADKKIPFERFLKTNPSQTPALSSLGFATSRIKIPDSQIPITVIKNYDKNRDYPGRNGTSKLGIHLRFGTISIREVVETAAKTNSVWLNELIWREFYSSILQHFPYVTTGAFKKKYDLIPWRNNPNEFESWCSGKTGYPLVDAGMRELNTTGYMHNRVRMVAAGFLTKHLLTDWRWGEAYFAEKLLDFELASNNGGWQWAAGTGTDAQPYFRVFNPESQAAKFDPDFKYIKRWIPEYGTVKYPKPIVDHRFARMRAIETYKSVVS
jgi:deoxyribodipyrimidine photo-lyase